MRQLLSAAAAIAALGLAAPAFAQTTSGSTAPPAGASTDARAGATTGATTGAAAGTSAGASTDAAAPSAASAGANASVTAGMTVKDKTGASIGQVSDVKSEGGKTMATIKMGAETFAVDASNLGVADGAATINATQAEIQSMLKK
ncbi:hypothetical protein [Phenylobacterium sp.]|uniref:hypothetical protein n=1 Tax=Phenylobacterium sp. TaxID=1871053 RepID=UPI0028123577|nr:hypothetical protein [Phenylobacterium sp.]